MTDLSSKYWNDRYLQGQTGWDIGHVSPPLQVYFDQLPDKNIAILIPGCGNSYEAGYLLEKGFTNITLLDISPLLIARLKEKLPAATLIEGDFFNHDGQYDLIVEQTFFCALDPAQRPHYIEKTYDLLKPGGHLAGLLFDRDFKGGPPFGGHKTEYQQLLEKKFSIKTLEPCYNSIKPRAGTELFLIAEKTARQ